MKLTFRTPYLSITKFPDVEIAPFTVVTGENGAGKTHMLRAIQRGDITVDCASNPAQEIRYFDWNSMIPKDTGLFDGHAILTERTKTWEKLKAWQTQRFSNHKQQIVVADPALAEISAFKTAILENRLPRNLTVVSAGIEQGIKNNLNSDKEASTVTNEVSQITKKPILCLDKEDFLEVETPSWGAAEIFQQSFARLFVSYRDLRLKNQVKQLAVSKGRADIECLSDDDFTDRYMIPPWDFVNSALASANLPFTINKPDEFSDAPYDARLLRQPSGIEVRFSDLSSGEKVLMSFALCLYYAEDRRQLTNYPKVLLLDEIDAPLHPSMTRSLLRTITKTLVEKHNVNVILATHSPSTVALASEDAIHVMRTGESGLKKISKSEALNLLTVGVPTLSLSYDGRRQVFVESQNDAEIFSELYQLLKISLLAERSLEFVATGTGGGDQTNTGCDAVRFLVNQLAQSGNKSVFGLIDWDGKNVGSSRLIVLGADERYAVENFVLDPLAVAALIIRDARTYLESMGLANDTSYVAFLNSSPSQLQRAIDFVQAAVLGVAADDEELVEVQYGGGFTLNVRAIYLRMNGHNLEKRVLDAFPALHGIVKNRAAALMLHVVRHIFRDKTDFIPHGIAAALAAILTADAH